MFRNFFLTITIMLFFNNISSAQENLNLKYVDLNFIINNSIIGKKIKENLKNKNKIIVQNHSKIEKDLKNKKDKLISQQNILEKTEFEKKVINHQQKVKEYQIKVNKDLKQLNDDKLQMTNKLLKKIDSIMLEYVKNNEIDLIVKKESLIVSNSKLDITKSILTNLDNKHKKLE
jgi:outer membrane protein